MARYLRTMYRITDPDQSRAFYEARGRGRRELPIVRDGKPRQRTNFFEPASLPDDKANVVVTTSGFRSLERS